MRPTASARAVLLLALAANLLLASTLGIQPAHACSCSTGTPEEHLQNSEAVFSGAVVGVEKKVGFSTSPPGSVLGRVTFDVEESWKGISEEPVVVRGYGTGADCGIGFSEGQRYLVYAHGKPGGDAPLSTTYCAGTKLLGKAERDLQALGPASLTLPGSAEPETVDSTPIGGTWSGSAPVVVVASILLFVAAVGALALWRRRRPI